jgi:hypothetical protein
MANIYNTNPIHIDVDMTAGWRSLQTLSGTPMGIRVVKILLTGNPTAAAGSITITDPNDGTVLLALPVTSSMSPIQFDFQTAGVGWRDFQVTGVTATTTALKIWYKH